jgi:lysophospholipase L1-like esterase
VKGWPGTAHPDLPTVRMLHVGDCSLRTMESSHDFCAPLGYPRVAAEALLEQGIGTEFSHYFAVLFEHLPDMELLRRRMKLSGDPDVIVVQVGASYARRLILPDTRAIMRLRSDLGRRLGPRVFNVYRPLRPVVRHIGRHPTEWHGSEALERFLRDVRWEWPEASVVLLQPFLGVHPYPTQLPIRARTAAHVHAAAERCGVPELDFTDLLGTDPSLRGANGHNLNARGSELVGRELADWVLAGQPPSSVRALDVRRPVRA